MSWGYPNSMLIRDSTRISGVPLNLGSLERDIPKLIKKKKRFWNLGEICLVEEILLTGWGWYFIPLFTRFYTSQVVSRIFAPWRVYDQLHPDVFLPTSVELELSWRCLPSKLLSGFRGFGNQNKVTSGFFLFALNIWAFWGGFMGGVASVSLSALDMNEAGVKSWNVFYSSGRNKNDTHVCLHLLVFACVVLVIFKWLKIFG